MLLQSLAALALVATAVMAADASATLYRYVDPNGRVVYSDQPPPVSAKDVQPKSLPDNVIDTDPLPLAAEQAAKNFPVKAMICWACGNESGGVFSEAVAL